MVYEEIILEGIKEILNSEQKPTKNLTVEEIKLAKICGCYDAYVLFNPSRR